MEYQSIYCYYLENSFEFLMQKFTLWPKVHYNHFYTPMVKIWNIYTGSTRDYLLKQLFTKFLTWYQLEIWMEDDLMNVVTWFFLELLSFKFLLEMSVSMKYKLGLNAFNKRTMYNLKTRFLDIVTWPKQFHFS